MKLVPASMSRPLAGPALGLVLVLGLAAATRPAFAQIDSREGIALQNQILELRQEIQQLGSGAQQSAPPQQEPQYAPPVGAQPGQNGDTVAQLVVRVSALEEQMRQLQGRVDDISNQLQRQNDALTKQIGDLAFKLGQGGAASSGAQTSPGPDSDGTQLVSPGEPPLSANPGRNPPPPQAMKPPMKRPPEIALREGNAALARRDYTAAAAAAQEVISSGKSVRGTDAQLLLARAESGQHNYRQAAADFYDAYNRSPRSPQAPAALLGVANSLIALNDGKDACQALAKLGAEFPNPPGGVKASAARARKQAACH